LQIEHCPPNTILADKTSTTTTIFFILFSLRLCNIVPNPKLFVGRFSTRKQRNIDRGEFTAIQGGDEMNKDELGAVRVY
jgi:hypothetical protein